MYIKIFFIFCITLAINCQAFLLRGTILNEQGEGIPYANVSIKNSSKGVTSNLKGEYFIELDQGEYDLIFSYIAYKQKEIHISIYGNQIKNIVLEIETKEIEEITVSVTKRDYAYEIISKTIENKKNLKNQYKNYKCNAYLKASLERIPKNNNTIFDTIHFDTSGTPIIEKMDFIESYSDVYFSEPSNLKEIKNGYRDFSKKTNSTVVNFNVESEEYGAKSVVNSNIFKANITDATFDFYKNLIYVPALGEIPFTSPLSNSAFLSYNFKFIEDFEENGKTINKIQVTPKNSSGALFEGYVYIIENEWVLQAVDLRINSLSMLKFNHFNVNQQYEINEKGILYLKQEEFSYHTKSGRYNLLGTTNIYYKNYEFDIDFNNVKMNNEVLVIVDEAMERDSSYWEENRAITLKDEELEFIKTEDSIIQFHKSETYLNSIDSAANKLNIWSFLNMGIWHQNSFKKYEFFFEPLTNQLMPFGVGGYRHKLGGYFSKEFTKANKIQLDYQLDYGFNNKDLKGFVEPEYTYNPKKMASIYVHLGKTFDVINNYESIQASFSRGNYIQSLSYRIGHRFEVINGFYMDSEVEYTQKTSIENYILSEWSKELFGKYNEPVKFDGYNQFILDFNFRIRFDQKYKSEPFKKIVIGSKYPKLDIQYKKGIPSIGGSAVNFDFLELKLTDDIKVGTFGSLKYKAYSGRFINGKEVQFTDYKFFRGSDRYIFSNPLRSFQLLDTALLSTKKAYLQTTLLHRFNGALMNKVPLFKKMKMQSLAGAGALMLEDNSFRHVELFIGVEKPFKLWKQLFKFGVYYVTSDSNFSKLDSRIKIGIDMFNSYNNSWSY